MRQNRTFTTLLVSVAVLISFHVRSQETNEAALKNSLAAKTFTFKAQTAWPLRGNVVQLTPGFDMKVLGDSINTYLPYFGRAYQANYNGNGGGISFTSTRFEYKLKESKSGWELLIKPGDVKDIQQLIYTVSTNGYATLQVFSNTRQAISFYGIIEKR